MGRFVKRPNFKCPHCGSSMYIRSSRQQHPLLRALGLQCSNFCCGFFCRWKLWNYTSNLSQCYAQSYYPTPNTRSNQCRTESGKRWTHGRSKRWLNFYFLLSSWERSSTVIYFLNLFMAYRIYKWYLTIQLIGLHFSNGLFEVLYLVLVSCLLWLFLLK